MSSELNESNRMEFLRPEALKVIIFFLYSKEGSYLPMKLFSVNEVVNIVDDLTKVGLGGYFRLDKFLTLDTINKGSICPTDRLVNQYLYQFKTFIEKNEGIRFDELVNETEFWETSEMYQLLHLKLVTTGTDVLRSFIKEYVICFGREIKDNRIYLPFRNVENIIDEYFVQEGKRVIARKIDQIMEQAKFFELLLFLEYHEKVTIQSTRFIELDFSYEFEILMVVHYHKLAINDFVCKYDPIATGEKYQISQDGILIKVTKGEKEHTLFDRGSALQRTLEYLIRKGSVTASQYKQELNIDRPFYATKQSINQKFRQVTGTNKELIIKGKYTFIFNPSLVLVT